MSNNQRHKTFAFQNIKLLKYSSSKTFDTWNIWHQNILESKIFGCLMFPISCVSSWWYYTIKKTK